MGFSLVPAGRPIFSFPQVRRHGSGSISRRLSLVRLQIDSESYPPAALQQARAQAPIAYNSEERFDRRLMKDRWKEGHYVGQLSPSRRLVDGYTVVRASKLKDLERGAFELFRVCAYRMGS